MKRFLAPGAGLFFFLVPCALRAAEGAAGPDQAICGTATILGADPLLPGQAGAWTVLSGTAVFANAASPVSQVTGLAPGDNVLQWAVFGDGPPEFDQMIITVYDPAATVAFAGPDSVLCLPTDTMHLMATPPASPAIGSWAAVGIALIDVFSDPTSAVEFPAGGTVQMIWTVFNGTCGQAMDTVVISVQECVIGVNEAPTAPCPQFRFDGVANRLWLTNVTVGVQLDVLDLNGRIILSSTVRSPSDGGLYLDGVPPGAYIVRILSQHRSDSARIVIMR